MGTRPLYWILTSPSFALNVPPVKPLPFSFIAPLPELVVLNKKENLELRPVRKFYGWIQNDR
jgi:hypothetical protein